MSDWYTSSSLSSTPRTPIAALVLVLLFGGGLMVGLMLGLAWARPSDNGRYIVLTTASGSGVVDTRTGEVFHVYPFDGKRGPGRFQTVHPQNAAKEK